MSRSPRYDAPGRIQHVMTRGLEKRLLFLDDDDREVYVRIMRAVFRDTGTRCLAWALMPNHTHQVTQTGAVPLSRVMHRVNTCYAGAFNRRHGRVGPLFQGRFLSKPIDSREYLYEVVRYVHLNPVRGGIVADLDALGSYPWTGHSALISGVDDGIIDLDAVTAMFTFGGRSPRVAMLEYMLERVASTEPPLALIEASVPHASVETRHERAEPEIWTRCRDGRWVSEIRAMASVQERRRALFEAAGVTASVVRRAVCRRLGASIRALEDGARDARTSLARSVAAWVAHTYLGTTDAELARLLGVSRQAVPACIRRGSARVRLFDPRGRLDRYLA